MPHHPDTGRYVYPGSLLDVFWASWGESKPVWIGLNPKLVALCDLHTDWPDGRKWPEELGFAFEPKNDDDALDEVMWLIEGVQQQVAPLEAWKPDPAAAGAEGLYVRRVPFPDLHDDAVETLETTRTYERNPWLPEGAPSLDDRDWLDVEGMTGA